MPIVAELVAVFREVRRVLRDDGTLWLNLGDSYAGAGNHARSPETVPDIRPAQQKTADASGYMPA